MKYSQIRTRSITSIAHVLHHVTIPSRRQSFPPLFSQTQTHPNVPNPQFCIRYFPTLNNLLHHYNRRLHPKCHTKTVRHGDGGVTPKHHTILAPSPHYHLATSSQLPCNLDSDVQILIHIYVRVVKTHITIQSPHTTTFHRSTQNLKHLLTLQIYHTLSIATPR
jgi:hypothetical protein